MLHLFGDKHQVFTLKMHVFKNWTRGLLIKLFYYLVFASTFLIMVCIWELESTFVKV